MTRLVECLVYLTRLLFERCFINWIKQVIEVTDGQVVAVDGKQLRRSYDTATDHGAIRLVSAWASAQSVTLGQQKVADDSNEIPAIPQLLELLTLSGCIVTTDAMGCHPQIAQQIVDVRCGLCARIESESRSTA